MNRKEVRDHLRRNVLPVWRKQKALFLTETEWEACYLNRITTAEKRENERALEELRKLIRSNPKALDAFIQQEKILYVEQYMGRELFEEYHREMCRFLHKCRQFDPKLSWSELWQALRNYMIYGMIRAMIGEKQDAHDAIMAYSLLYPYTDNTIDDPTRSQQEKAAFNQMISDCLEGKEAFATDQVSIQTMKCLALCLSYLSEEKEEETAEILQVILEAQAESTNYMGLSDGEIREQMDQLMDTLSYKGGASVLIDYYFAIPSMKSEDITFFLQFGMILQFADDIQDLQEDIENVSPTYYSTAEDTRNREERFYELLHFVKTVFEHYPAENEKVRQFMLRNCQIMLLFVVLRSRAFFSEELIMAIEPYIPFSYSYLAELQKELGKRKSLHPEEQGNWLRFIDAYCEKVLAE